MVEQKLYGKRIALIIAFRDFRDAEYFVPKEIFEKEGADVISVSTKRGMALGADGGEVYTDVLIDEVKPENFDAIIFLGGPGALEYLDNKTSYEVAKKTIEKNRILGAICVAPVILAKAELLSGKNATVWSSPMDRQPVRILKYYGAIYQDAAVVVDGKIITANGPDAADEFAKKIVSLLTKEPERLNS